MATAVPSVEDLIAQAQAQAAIAQRIADGQRAAEAAQHRRTQRAELRERRRTLEQRCEIHPRPGEVAELIAINHQLNQLWSETMAATATAHTDYLMRAGDQRLEA